MALKAPIHDIGAGTGKMETAALYIVAAAAKKNVMNVSEHIVTGEKTTAQERQNNFTNRMEIALEML